MAANIKLTALGAARHFLLGLYERPGFQDALADTPRKTVMQVETEIENELRNVIEEAIRDCLP